MPETFLGRVKELDYKTIRYAGHCERFKAMIDLGLCSSDTIIAGSANVKPREVFGALLQRNLPADKPDYVLIRLDFVGVRNDEREKMRYDIVTDSTKRRI